MGPYTVIVHEETWNHDFLILYSIIIKLLHSYVLSTVVNLEKTNFLIISYLPYPFSLALPVVLPYR